MELREGTYQVDDRGEIILANDYGTSARVTAGVHLAAQLVHTRRFLARNARTHPILVYDQKEVSLALQGLVELNREGDVQVTFRLASDPLDSLHNTHLLRMALDQTNDVVLVTEGEWENGPPRILFVNAAFTRMTGYASSEVIGQTPKILQGPKTDPLTRQWLRSQLSQWRPARAELLNYRKDGSEFWVEIDLAPVADPSGWYTNWIGIQRETTQRRLREEQNLIASKMEWLGVLGGGIAHDFNNILTSILACSSVADRMIAKLGTAPPVLEARSVVADIERAVNHARSLTKQLLGLAKGGSSVLGAVDVSRLVEEMIALALRGSDITPVVDTDTAWVEGDTGQIGQAILNLLINGRQAMPRGGTLSAHVRTCEASEGSVAIPAPRYVEVRIRDEGLGVRDVDKARIFEPYFTTKGEGAGLGLAVVYSVVSKHRGTVTVESELGHYTEFCIRLPAIDPPKLDDVPKVDTASGSKFEKLLLLDDEPRIVWSLSLLLRDLGYEVEAFVDGHAAVDAFRASRHGPSPFTMALLDLTIPGSISGYEVAARLRELDGSVLIYMMSGYSDAIADLRQDSSLVAGFLEKPFNIDTLARVLSSAPSSRKL